MDVSFLNMGDEEDQMNQKRSDEQTAEDRISRLPDPLLSQILSHASTKDAVRTSVLSTRWRSLWSSVPGLDLDSYYFSNEDDFVSFVDKFLDCRDKLYKFRLRYDLAEHDALHFKSWINSVVNRKIQDVDVHNFMDDGVVMPPRLFVCETLVSLKLTHAILDIPEIVSLPCVKSMHLDYVQYADDSALDRLISCSPTLEDLMMIRNPDDNIKVLRVRSKTLKRFEVELERFKDSREHGVVIDTPKLEYLNLRDHQSASFVINNLDSSVKLDINVIFNVDYEDKLDPDDISKRNSIREFLIGISNVNHMIISHDTLEILHSYSMLEALPQFHNLSHLEASFGWKMSNSFRWKTFSTFLKSCPNLKSLVVFWDLSSGMEEIEPSSVPQCFLSSLESIEIKRPIMGDAEEMELIRYFLENSAVLKKLIIRIICFPGMKEESVILEELETFPRRSSACQVVVL